MSDLDFPEPKLSALPPLDIDPGTLKPFTPTEIVLVPTGVEGPRGPAGDRGPAGERGDKGDPGEGLQIRAAVQAYADLKAVDTSKLPPYSLALVRATAKLYIWDGKTWPAESGGLSAFGPKGDQGDPGKNGSDGRGIADISADDAGLSFTMSAGPSPVAVPVPAVKAAADAAANARASKDAAAQSATASAGSATAASQSELNAKKSADEAKAAAAQGPPPATANQAGVIKLPGSKPGELGGTANSPTVTGWANKADTADVARKYEKPANGIPRADLAADVTAAMDLAASAVQGNDSRLTDARPPTDASVTTAKLADASVTPAKLGVGTVTGYKGQTLTPTSFKLVVVTEAEFAKLTPQTDTIYLRTA